MRKLLTILVVLFMGTTSHAQTITLGDINHDGLVSGSYSVESNDPGVATAVVNGTSVNVTAVGGGTATITVTDIKHVPVD